MIINYYESGSTAVVRPSKKPPIEYDPSKEKIKKARQRRNYINNRKKSTKSNGIYNYEKETATVNEEDKREILNAKRLQCEQTRKYTKIILGIVIIFGILFLLCYQSSLINTSLNEKEQLKTELAEIKKKNEQLKVNIEQKMNINTVEQEAKDELGMQKLDNSQKVYININKDDYTESSTNDNKNENENKSWWSQFIKDLFNH